MSPRGAQLGNFTSRTSSQLPLPREGISSRKRGISATNDGNGSNRWNCLVFPQAVSPFIPREIFARPYFDCTPSGSSFLILEIRHLNFSGCHPRSHYRRLRRRRHRRRFPLRGTVFNSIYNRTAKYRSFGNCCFVAQVLRCCAA